MSDKPKIDTTNEYLIGVQGDRIHMLRRVPMSMTKLQARRLAAHLYLLSQTGDGPTFEEFANAFASQ